MSKDQKVKCSMCGKLVTRQGLPGHMRFKHGVESKRHKPAGPARRPEGAQSRRPPGGARSPEELIQRLRDRTFTDGDKQECEEIVNILNEHILKPKGVRLALVSIEAEQESERNFLELDAETKMRYEDYEFPGSEWDDTLKKYIKIIQK